MIAVASSVMPGPMVALIVMLLMYAPFAAAGFARTSSRRNAVAPAKILIDFAKEHERPKVKAAVVDGHLFDTRAVAQLALLPSREVLLQQVLGTFIAPMTQLLGLIEELLRTPGHMADALERERSKAS